MLRNFLLVLFLYAASLGVSSAQAPSPNPCSPIIETSDIHSGALKHLACEWRKAWAIANLLDALEDYARGENRWTNAVEKVFASADDADRNFYKPALGIRDQNGQPRRQGLGAFLEIVATANLLNTQKMTVEENNTLFSDATNVIESIFADGGKQDLVDINDSFQSEMYLRALARLLRAVPKPAPGAEAQYASKLEVLRAAYQKDRGRLILLVAAKISGTN